MTSWEPVIYSPASRIFGKESEALEWCIDQAETRIRDLTRTLFHVHDREADERAEQFPNEEEAIPNETVGIIPTATTPTEASPDVSTLGAEAASRQFDSPADVPSEGRGECQSCRGTGYVYRDCMIHSLGVKPCPECSSPPILPTQAQLDAYIDNARNHVRADGDGREPVDLLPFNLSDALAGKPVVTRDGQVANGFRRRPNAHFSGYDYEVEVDNVWRSYKPDGRWMGKTDSIFDLFMLPTEGSGA